MGDAPTQGRRAGRRAGGGSGGPASDAFAADAKVASGWDTPERAAAPPQPAAEAGGSPEEGPRHGRRKGGAASGWGEPAADAAPASPTQKPPTPEPARRSSPDSDDDGVMQIIPDLEEEIQEEEIRQIAEAAPTQHEMQTIDELDHETAGGLHSMIDHGIDLTLLTSCLSSQSHVEEEDREWDFNGLLAEVSQVLQAEIDKKEKAAEEEEEKEEAKKAGGS